MFLKYCLISVGNVEYLLTAVRFDSIGFSSHYHVEVEVQYSQVSPVVAKQRSTQ